MKRRTEITVEEHIRIVRRAGASVKTACAECGGQVLMATPEEAALAIGVSARAIYRWVEERKIHFHENASGVLMVCPRSILKQVRKT